MMMMVFFWTREFGDLGNWDEIRVVNYLIKLFDVLNKKMIEH